MKMLRWLGRPGNEKHPTCSRSAEKEPRRNWITAKPFRKLASSSRKRQPFFT